MTLRISGIAPDSITDGPGMRLAVFAQGCPHRCPGCHNPATHPFEGGEEMDAGELAARALRNPLCSGVTLSGGEPFCQAGEMAALARDVREGGKNVWVYTGYLLEDLLRKAQDDDAVRALLQEADAVVDGPFLLLERSLALTFRGSRNQRIWLRSGEGLLFEDRTEDF